MFYLGHAYCSLWRCDFVQRNCLLISELAKHPVSHCCEKRRREEIHAKYDTFQDCEQCLRATSSVMDANLLLFKTVIAGDSWGTIAVPVIEILGLHFGWCLAPSHLCMKSSD